MLIFMFEINNDLGTCCINSSDPLLHIDSLATNCYSAQLFEVLLTRAVQLQHIIIVNPIAEIEIRGVCVVAK